MPLQSRPSEVLAGTVRKLETLSDGTVRLRIDVDPEHRRQALDLADPGAMVAIARISDESAQAYQRERVLAGQRAKELRLSGFFRSPDVWAAIGSPEDYLAWLRDQPCAVGPVGCSGPTEAAHVRRISEGAGVGLKPKWHAIPLCQGHHRLQHQKGESAIGGKELLDKLAVRYVQEWAWEALKRRLGYEHWTEVPVADLQEWAERHGLERYLPESWRS